MILEQSTVALTPCGLSHALPVPWHAEVGVTRIESGEGWKLIMKVLAGSNVKDENFVVPVQLRTLFSVEDWKRLKEKVRG